VDENVAQFSKDNLSKIRRDGVADKVMNCSSSFGELMLEGVGVGDRL
jgi:hypothetical protein